MMADIVYGRRAASNADYDTSFIEHLEGLGLTVDSIPEGDVSSYNYDGVLLFIVGAPGTGYTGHSAAATITSLEMPVISMCRYVSRVTLGMAGASGDRTVSHFTVVDEDHPINEGLSGEITIGSSASQHGIWNLTSGTNLILREHSSGYAGVAERESSGYKRIHFSYHRGDLLNSDGWDIFDRVLEYLGVSKLPYLPSGGYVSTSIDATTLPTSPRIRWTADTPPDTSIKVEVSQTATDSEPGAWTEVTESEIINMTDNYLWLKYTLETEDEEVTPTLEAVWLEESDVQDTILLTFDEQNRFNHVEGNLTVAYSQAVGNLTGESPVEDFSQVFLPLSLEPDPLDQHTITVEGTELDVDFKLVTYHDGHTDHSITVEGTEVFVDFMHVEDIPP